MWTRTEMVNSSHPTEMVNASGGSVVDEFSGMSYMKNRAYVTSPFVLDAITL